MRFRKATIAASSSGDNTLEQGFFGPVVRSSTEVRFFHLSENIAPLKSGTK